MAILYGCPDVPVRSRISPVAAVTAQPVASPVDTMNQLKGRSVSVWVAPRSVAHGLVPLPTTMLFVVDVFSM
jgi:hypothetical protein